MEPIFAASAVLWQLQKCESPFPCFSFVFDITATRADLKKTTDTENVFEIWISLAQETWGFFSFSWSYDWLKSDTWNDVILSPMVKENQISL